jgi:DNA-binding response OmpR family regulator
MGQTLAGDSPHVLVVDDDQDVADLFELRLRDRYETTVVYGGDAALEAMDETVDAVLLDRRMPDRHGDDVLATIRERGYDVPVVMTTAVDPDLNILEMEFDDYLCKPILEETLVETLETLVATERDPDLADFFGLLSKLAVLEEEKTAAELDADDRYQAMRRRANALRATLSESVDDFEELVETHRSIERKG